MDCDIGHNRTIHSYQNKLWLVHWDHEAFDIIDTKDHKCKGDTCPSKQSTPNTFPELQTVK